MLIDWFTVGAQALNFLILLWLMKRFLYAPILRAIDAREKRIAAELADAAAKQSEAARERAEFQHKNEAFDQQRATLLQQATDAAAAEHRRLLDLARKAVEVFTAKRQDSLKSDARDLQRALIERAQHEVFAIARKALAELATSSLEERMSDVFTRRLRALDGEAKACLGEALETAGEPALVRSAFELPAPQRAAIQRALDEAFSTQLPLRFEAAPDLVSGIELVTQGQKLAWSIADYLKSLQRGVGELLTAQFESEQAVEPEAPTAPQPSVHEQHA